jgi:hypothetical protein
MSPHVFAIDPGPEVSAFVYWDHSKQEIMDHGIIKNDVMLWKLNCMVSVPYESVAIEMIASYGMPVGREVFETCVWIGRFIQSCPIPREAKLYYRKDIKLHLCGSPRAKDGNVRQALLDLVGPQGKKAQPGPTYGIKSHAWAALAVAVYAGHVASQPHLPL